MKDLDFDELDRAVNSLLTNNGAPAQESTPPASPVVEDTTPAASDTTDSVEPRPVTQPLAARRSSGRFMDVVHPSSDMRASIPTRPVSREGATLTPTSLPSSFVPSQDTASLSSNDTVPSDVPEVPTQQSEAPASSAQPVASEWPDPLDFNGFSANDDSSPSVDLVAPEQPEVSPSPSPVDDDTDINQIADDINRTLSQDQSAQTPLESPFLTDAKVEKRPLGAFSTDTPTPVTAPEVVSEEVVTVPEEHAVPAVDEATDEAVVPSDTSDEDVPTQLDTPLPAELQDNLLQIEADVDTTSSQTKKEEPAPVQPLPQPVVQVDTTGGPTSIAQQYTEQPSTGDQPTGAIFDTEAYRKPLSHPAKKKSGWIYVVWILALLVVGAGAGAAVYFFVLPKM